MNKLSKPVVVSVDECYNENNGSYQVAYLWDGESVTTEGGIYCNKLYSVDCTPEQLQSAIEWQRENTPLTIPYNKYCYNRLGAHTYIGCVVKLKRSRLAPNGVELTVTDFHESYYCQRFNQTVTEKITVTDGNESWVVSSGCIADVVRGVKEYVYWADKSL